MTDLWVTLRYANLIISFICFWLLLYYGIRYWVDDRRRTTFQPFGVATLCWTFTTAWGSAEVLVESVEGGPRVIFFLISNLITVWAIWKVVSKIVGTRD